MYDIESLQKGLHRQNQSNRKQVQPTVLELRRNSKMFTENAFYRGLVVVVEIFWPIITIESLLVPIWRTNGGERLATSLSLMGKNNTQCLKRDPNKQLCFCRHRRISPSLHKILGIIFFVFLIKAANPGKFLSQKKRLSFLNRKNKRFCSSCSFR